MTLGEGGQAVYLHGTAEAPLPPPSASTCDVCNVEVGFLPCGPVAKS
jgi:hypothetical protein